MSEDFPKFLRVIGMHISPGTLLRCRRKDGTKKEEVISFDNVSFEWNQQVQSKFDEFFFPFLSFNMPTIVRFTDANGLKIFCVAKATEALEIERKSDSDNLEVSPSSC